MQIDKQDENADGTTPASIDDTDVELIAMNQELSTVNRDFQNIQERFKRINIVNDQISNWARRCYMKFGALSENTDF